MTEPATPHSESKTRAFGVWALYAVTCLSFLVLFHNYGLSIFPSARLEIPPTKIHPYSGQPSFAYAFNFNASEPNRDWSPSSRVSFFEAGERYPANLAKTDEVALVGGDRFSHQPGVIVFATSDNSDPRTNGRHYAVEFPILYSNGIGSFSIAVFGICVALLYRRRRQPSLPIVAQDPSGLVWRLHLWGAAALFTLGLYLNTGSLAPYAITAGPGPIVDASTGYAYNPDHVHFRVLFDFVDGRDRSVWDHALFLRRVLFPVIGWPLMKCFGFEVGGAITGIGLSLATLLVSLCYLRRTIGAKGAILAGWLLSLYPGAAYWEGLPYSHSLIFPFSLLLLIGLYELKESQGRKLVLISLAMGIAYLGYDFAAFFIPSSVLVLALRRRVGSAVVTALLQAIPTALWLLILAHGLRQPLENSNSGIYREVIGAYLHATGVGSFWPHLRLIASTGMGIFFGANFIFLPALFLAVVAMNATTSRVKMDLAEAVLLFTALGLFLFLNMAPEYGGTWVMRGTWISRIYQPIFAALIFFIARWRQQLPREIAPVRGTIMAVVLMASAGNALIVFGPIANNPLSISQAAFYRFYNHTDWHQTYTNSLARLGRRPLGFEQAQPKPQSSLAIVAAERLQLDAARNGLHDARRALAQNRKAYLETARALAANRFELIVIESRLRPPGAIPPLPASADELLPAPARAIAADPSLTEAPAEASSRTKGALSRAQVTAEIAATALEAEQVSTALSETIGLLGNTQLELSKAITALQKAQKELEAKAKARTP